MLDGKGNVVQPDYVTVYYKRRPLSDPKCGGLNSVANAEGTCVAIPNGLRFVFGWDPTGINSIPTGFGYFNCQGPTAAPGHYSTIIQAAAKCPAGAGNLLGFIIMAPTCWNGTQLDVPDHRSHVIYMDPHHGGTGQPTCRADHPFVIPSFLLGTWYSVKAGDDPTLWSFSSDAMAPGEPHGYTMHGDFFEAWDPAVKAMWTESCVDKLLNCSAGDLGNGKQLIGPVPAYGWVNPVHLVPIPSMPRM
jgi:hypothetical protein